MILSFSWMIAAVTAISFHHDSPVVVEASEEVTFNLQLESPHDGSWAQVTNWPSSLQDFTPEDASSSRIALNIPRDAEKGFKEILVETDTGAQCKHFIFIK